MRLSLFSSIRKILLLFIYIIVMMHSNVLMYELCKPTQVNESDIKSFLTKDTTDSYRLSMYSDKHLRYSDTAFMKGF
jgi:hypothetical protein